MLPNKNIQICEYHQIKDQIVIEGANPLRELSDEEKERLINSLLQDGCVTGAITVVGPSMLVKYRVSNGRHRWSVLPEVYKRDPNFSTKIPLLVKQHFGHSSEERKYAIINQLGQRNLTSKEIIDYVDILIEEGLSRRKAYQQIAQELGVSENTVRRRAQPDYAQKERERRLETNKEPNETMRDTADICSTVEQKTPETIETSFPSELDEETVTNSAPHTVDTEAAPQLKKSNLLGSETEEQVFNNIQDLEDRFKINPDGTEEYTARISSELERLTYLEDTINELKGDLSFFKGFSIYNDISTLISNYETRFKYLKKNNK